LGGVILPATLMVNLFKQRDCRTSVEASTRYRTDSKRPALMAWPCRWPPAPKVLPPSAGRPRRDAFLWPSTHCGGDGLS